MKSIVILSFLYNDWASARDLFRCIGTELSQRDLTAKLVLIDDGSLTRRPADFLKTPLGGFSSIELLTLRKNVGHQRAISIGLSYLSEHMEAGASVVMDCDGEDRPEDLIRLIEAYNNLKEPKIIFAERTRRTEGFGFRFFYQVYRILHFLLTGYRIRFGNFSIVPKELLVRLVLDPNLWIHYAASVVAAGIPYTSIPTHRGARLHGKSTLDFKKLVVHGLSAISCYNEIVGVRLLISLLSLSAVLGILFFGVIGIRVFTHLAIPGWATYTAGILIIVIMQAVLISGACVLFALSGRKAGFHLPVERYEIFLYEKEQL